MISILDADPGVVDSDPVLTLKEEKKPDLDPTLEQKYLPRICLTRKTGSGSVSDARKNNQDLSLSI